MKSHFLSLTKFFIGWPLSLLALFFIAKIFMQQKISIATLMHLNWYFLAVSFMCFIVYFIFRILAWHDLTKEKGIQVPFGETAYLWSISELKRYVPGNIWSFLGRAQSYEKHHVPKKTIAHLLLLEILFLVVSAFTVSLISANFVFYGIVPHFPFMHILIPIFISVSIVGAIVFVLNPYTLRKIILVKNLFLLGPKENIRVFTYMSIAFLFFGLGTYSSVSAVSLLYLPHIISLSAFFVFTYLIAYLSFITPMGLGVREGIMTIGLVKYIPLVSAATGAILSRIILIISEVVFLMFAWLWLKLSKKRLVRNCKNLIKQHSYEIYLFTAMLIYSIYFSVTSFLRYLNFYTGRFDLGNMDQTVWNTIHGRIFQLTNPDGTNIISRLAFHADFILVFISPFYYIWQDPRMLLLLQSLALAAGAYFVYLIGKEIIKHKGLSLILALAYLIHPAINHANLFDFHAITLAVPLFLAAWYFILKNNYLSATLLILLASTTKEEVWLIAGMFGILFFLKRQRFLGTFVTVFSFSMFYYLFFKAIPQAHGGNHFALSYYSDFGTTPGGVIKNIFLSPLKILSVVLQSGRLWYLFEIFFPFAFLSLFSPLFLIFAGPDLAVSLLSQNSQLYNIYFHYASIVVPFAFLSTVYGIAFLKKKFPQLSFFYLGIILIATSVSAAYWYGPLPGAKHMNKDMYTNQLPYREEIDDFLDTIPRRYSVAATNNIGSHLSHRQRIYTIPVGMEKADVIVFLLNDQFAQPSLEAQREFVQTLSQDPHYIKVYEYQDFVLFTKKGLPLHKLRKSRTFSPPTFH